MLFKVCPWKVFNIKANLHLFFLHSTDISTTDNNETASNSIINTPDQRHKRLRDEAEADYLKAIAKRQKLYDNAIKQQQYAVGDLVGLQVDRVDRTNTTPKILPCKVISTHSSTNDLIMYKLCTLKGILSASYGVEALLDLRKCNFTELRGVDPATLPTIAFTQACKEYMSVETDLLAGACQCAGKCATKSSPCKAKDVKCCSKCHPKKKGGCANS